MLDEHRRQHRAGIGEQFPLRAGKADAGGLDVSGDQQPVVPGRLLLSTAGGGLHELLWRQLTSLSISASTACQSFLLKKDIPDVLLDVEPLFDGRTLYFHFLGTPSHETEQYVQELSDVYQKSVASSRFALLLEHGCGPGCGTKEKTGCGTGGGCAVCAIAGGCTSK